jgi:DNA mismatch repair protein MutL
MPKVLVLPDHIASQIAAGEVVERPSSVVKELVENSIDAGATQIEISVGADCRDIRVADNGCGMDPEDAVLAFHRHATSKLSTADDLWKLRTMGFRGEALPSVASVAKITCFTRTADAAAGTKICAADGKVTTTETGCAQGTVLEVTDLFYNVPARLKFLKKASTEFAHIFETIQALAVAFPKITFQLLNKGEMVFKTSGSGKLAQAMAETGFLSGKETLCQVTFAELSQGMGIYGYVARPTHFRGDRKGILAIVNNRPVRCHLTYKALDYAFQDLIPKGKYPLAALTMTLDPGNVDINVHPTKKEIKYTSSNEIYIALQRAIVNSIRQSAEEAGSTVDESPARQAQERQVYASASNTSAAESVNAPVVKEAIATETEMTPQRVSRPSADQIKFTERLNYTPPAVASRPNSISGLFTRARLTSSVPAGWRLLGYLNNTYILIETPEGLEIIEQHIAHERVIYERVLASQETAGRLTENSQRLVISVPLNLTAEQKDTVKNNQEKLQKVGFEFEFQGESSILCTQVPLELAHKDYAAAVQSIVESLAITENAELELEASKSVACQAAIKNGMALTEADIVQLLAEWIKTPRNDTCPHGRPIRLKISMEKLFQMFHPA